MRLWAGQPSLQHVDETSTSQLWTLHHKMLAQCKTKAKFQRGILSQVSAVHAILSLGDPESCSQALWPQLPGSQRIMRPTHLQ